MSASAYYQRKTGERSARAVEDERLTVGIHATHKANYEAYGYRRMHAQLVREDETAGRDQIARLMRTAGVQGAKRRGKPWRTTIPDPGAQRPADLVQRDFTADRPDALWVCDFTYLRCWEGRAFFAFVIDVFSRMVVGWQFASHMRTDLVLDALRMALGLRRPGADVALVHHSDAGSQYTSGDYQQELSDQRVLASIGTVGDCYDNALAESFVDSFKTELIADRVWRTRAQLELAVVEYLAWFNHVRLHSSLGNVPPAEHEQAHVAGVAAEPCNAVALQQLLISSTARLVYDPFRGRLRPTVFDNHTNQIYLLTEPTNPVSVNVRAVQNPSAMGNAKHLLLLRHAKSSWDDPAVRDHDRPLAPRGHKAAKLIGARLRTDQTPISLVLCSSARRARETLDLVAPPGKIEIDNRLYGASADELLERVRRVPDDVNAVMLVGHNPAIHDLAVDLLSNAGELAVAKFPTGALATLTFTGSWGSLAPRRAELVAFVKPRELG